MNGKNNDNSNVNLDGFKDDILFIPLGGVGEIGLNTYLYGYHGKWLMVDLGMGFADDTIPGIETLLPDTKFIESRLNDLLGLVITHAHLDHIGAIPHLWSRLKCPIYVTKFAKEMTAKMLEEAGLLKRVTLIEIEQNASFDVGPFNVAVIGTNHSIPEACTLVIRTKTGSVVHTGDWKFDKDPLIEKSANLQALAKAGDHGVLAVIGDSTNIFNEGFSTSESEVRQALSSLFGTLKGRIIITCFASNIARLESIAKVAQKQGRKVCLIGKSLWRADHIARSSGFLKDVQEFMYEDELEGVAKDGVVYICTGCQGEKRSALSSIATGDNRFLKIEKGDNIVFSSRVIPGNETDVSLLQNRLSTMGANVITEHKYPKIHASGHPAREDIRQMYGLIKPGVVIPVHGESYHLEEHSKFAHSMGIPNTLIIRDGDIVKISKEGASVVGEAETGILAIDGKRIIHLESDIIRKRKKAVYGGSLVITVVVDKKTKVMGEPIVSSIGLFEEDSLEVGTIRDMVKQVVSSLAEADKFNDFAIKEKIKIAVRKYVNEIQGNKPVTEIHLVRI